MHHLTLCIAEECNRLDHRNKFTFVNSFFFSKGQNIANTNCKRRGHGEKQNWALVTKINWTNPFLSSIGSSLKERFSRAEGDPACAWLQRKCNERKERVEKREGESEGGKGSGGGRKS